MQTITGNTPFRILGSHGVSEADIVALEGRFGRKIPANVVGPDDVILWALEVLPWTQVGAVLARWVSKAAKRGKILDDRRIQRALALLLAAPNGAAAQAAFSEIEELVVTLARVRGVDLQAPAEVTIERPDLDEEHRAWVATFAAVAAACDVAGGTAFTSGVEHSAACIQWVLSQEHRDTRPYFVDDAVCELSAAVADYVRTWAGRGGLG